MSVEPLEPTNQPKFMAALFLLKFYLTIYHLYIPCEHDINTCAVKY